MHLKAADPEVSQLLDLKDVSRRGREWTNSPTLPFKRPHKHRLITRDRNVPERPKDNIERVVPMRPIRKTGFLPIRSDARLHWSTVIASVTKNNDSYIISEGDEPTRDEEQENKINITHNQSGVVPYFLFVPLHNIEGANELNGRKREKEEEY